MKGAIIYLAVGLAMVLVEGGVARLGEVGAWLDIGLWPMLAAGEALHAHWLIPHRLTGWTQLAAGCAVLGVLLATADFEAFIPAEKEDDQAERRRRAIARR